MSCFATAWAWDQPVKQNEKLLLLFLADGADRSGTGGNLSDLLDHSQKVCGFDRQTMTTHFQSLERVGLIQRTNNDGYRLTLGDWEPTLGAFRLQVPTS